MPLLSSSVRFADQWFVQMYNDPNCHAWTSGRWAPPGYKNRNDLIEQTKAAEQGKPMAMRQGKVEEMNEKV